ncbi:MAG: GNAT family N-acetyltransferase [Dermatophilaceae bacterium]
MTLPLTVRAFAETDRPVLVSLFAEAGRGSPTGSLWGDPASEAAVYLDPYVDHEAGTVLLATAGGRPVGYLAGCIDSTRFPSEDERFTRAVREHRLMRRTAPMAFFARSLLDLARARVRRQAVAGELVDFRWPAHLHLNVVPEYRGAGAAPALMEAWLDHCRSAGSPGCYLQTLVENARAIAFFERCGFRRHGPTPPVPGVRIGGRRAHQLTMTIGLLPES